ncbi:ankyrin-3-like [Tachypleus tridentatus]|uniref:ankyrin-3-like n=1 Tax=Tachypleus tridentatus TaxID=6853 RepID=UPI003FD4ED6D
MGNTKSKQKKSETPSLEICLLEELHNDPSAYEKTKCFLTATKFGLLEYTQKLLSQGVDVNSSNLLGVSALHFAAKEGHYDVVKELIKNGADVNAKTIKLNTPLHLASIKGNIQIADLLVENGAHVNIQASLGFTPLYMASQENHARMVQFLLEYGADPHSAAEGGFTPLIVAQQQNCKEVISVLEKFEKEIESVKIPAVDVPDKLLGSLSFKVCEKLAEKSCSGQRLNECHEITFVVGPEGGILSQSGHLPFSMTFPTGCVSRSLAVTCCLRNGADNFCPLPLNDSEALVSYILEIRPVGAKLIHPVLIELHHFASYRPERKVFMLKSDVGDTWSLCYEGDSLPSSEPCDNGFTSATKASIFLKTLVLPRFLCIISSIHMDVKTVGTDGGKIASSLVPGAEIVLSPGSLLKPVNIGLSVQPVPVDLVKKVFGDHVTVSPILTVEPRYRKFHKACTLSIPLVNKGTVSLPVDDEKIITCNSITKQDHSNSEGELTSQSRSQDTRKMHLVCSLTGGNQQVEWLNITGSASMKKSKTYMSLSTYVTGRYCLVCQCYPITPVWWKDMVQLVSELYQEVVKIPIYVRFFLMIKRLKRGKAEICIICRVNIDGTDTNHVEGFSLATPSCTAEVFEKEQLHLDVQGNLRMDGNCSDQNYIEVNSFRQNTVRCLLKVKDSARQPFGSVKVTRNPKVMRRNEGSFVVCSFDIEL